MHRSIAISNNRRFIAINNVENENNSSSANPSHMNKTNPDVLCATEEAIQQKIVARIQ